MVRIYHNNRCSKSRATLALLEERGVVCDVVNYLDTPPSSAELMQLLDMLGMTPRELMRTGETEYTELGLDDPSLDDTTLNAAMVSHPRLPSARTWSMRWSAGEGGPTWQVRRCPR